MFGPTASNWCIVYFCESDRERLCHMLIEKSLPAEIGYGMDPDQYPAHERPPVVDHLRVRDSCGGRLVGGVSQKERIA